MCTSAGRRPSLWSPEDYRIPLPKLTTSGINHGQVQTDDQEAVRYSVKFLRAMVQLSGILAQFASSASVLREQSSLEMQSSKAMQLHNEIETWSSTLPSELKMESVSLLEPEGAMKQKLVLKLRE
jgi:hypothetical protein